MLMMIATPVLAQEEDFVRTFEKGVVVSIEEEDVTDNSFITKIQILQVEMITGEHKGEIVTVENVLSTSFITDIEVEVDQQILLAVEEYKDGTTHYFVQSEVRDHYIKYLLILFILALLLVGKMQGLKTIFTLGVTLFFIFFFELPLIIKGYNAVIVTVVVAIFITVITVTVISGLSKKTLAAVLGTTVGVVVAGGLAIFVSYKVNLTGLSMEEAMMLMSVYETELNFQHLLFASILLGALGAIMDVAMSIASSIDELHNVNNSLSFRELFSSGMRVGRDIMGTMANTLILAYMGSSLALVLLFMSVNDTALRIINLDVIATEIIRSLAGSIGLVATIPVTALIAVTLIKDKKFK